MSSVVSICNLALGNLGQDTITDLSEASSQARACNRFYEHTRDLLLSAYPWRFAGKTQSLAEVTNDKPGEWLYAYNRPGNCLKIRWVRKEYSEDDPCNETLQEQLARLYDYEGQTIYSNLSPAFLRFTQKLSDPTKFSPWFIEALSWHLAVRIAMPLTRDPKVRQEAFSVARQAQATAEMLDANEVRETSDHQSEYERARG